VQIFDDVMPNLAVFSYEGGHAQNQSAACREIYGPLLIKFTLQSL
jgi:hypothetical protein